MSKGKQGTNFFDKYVSLQVLEFMHKANEERNSYETAIGFIDRYIDKVVATEEVNAEKQRELDRKYWAKGVLYSKWVQSIRSPSHVDADRIGALLHEGLKNLNHFFKKAQGIKTMEKLECGIELLKLYHSSDKKCKTRKKVSEEVGNMLEYYSQNADKLSEETHLDL